MIANTYREEPSRNGAPTPSSPRAIFAYSKLWTSSHFASLFIHSGSADLIRKGRATAPGVNTKSEQYGPDNRCARYMGGGRLKLYE